MPKAPKPIANNTFEVELLGGDKVEIGDKESTDFKPHLKLNRWDGECFIAIQPAGEIESEFEPELEGDKIKYKYKVKQNGFELELESEFYALEPRTVIAKDKDGNDVLFTQNKLGGFEFEVILKKKPKTNQIVFDIEIQGLKFHYQPPLTTDEIADGAIRPDNVVGSYAVYHATKRDHIIGRTNYKCGKAFHIYRPKITDAEGEWIWGELSIDEDAGTLTVTIPQDFLDNAVYPISVDPNFGEEDEGGTTFGSSRIRGSFFTCPATADGTSISVYAKRDYFAGSSTFKCALYKESDDTFVKGTSEGEAAPLTPDWYTENFTDAPSLTNIDYWILAWSDDVFFTTYYDANSATGGQQEIAYNGWPSPTWSPTSEDKIYSIYCTYGEEAPPNKPHTFKLHLRPGHRMEFHPNLKLG